MRRYHVTTFGCQMNAHDSERIKGMLESLGLGEVTLEPEDGRRPRLQHVHDPGEARHEARGIPRRRGCAQAAAPGPRRRGGRLLCGGAARADLRAVPVRRRRVRPGLDPAPGRVDRGRRLRRFHGVDSDPTTRSRRRFRCIASAASAPGCRSRWAATRSAPTASCRRCGGESRAVGRARSSPRSRRWRGDGVREITLLGQNVNSWGRDLAPDAANGVRRAPARLRRVSRASSGSASPARTRRTSASR